MLLGPWPLSLTPIFIVSHCVLQACVWASPSTYAGIRLILVESTLEIALSISMFSVLFLQCSSVNGYFRCQCFHHLHNDLMMGPVLDLRELAFRGSTAIQSTGPQRGLRHVPSY